MNHRQRLENCLSGTIPDRPPVAFWRHFPVDDQSPGSLAAATLEFQSQFDFDLVKLSPASSFCVKDWGAQDEWRGNTEGSRTYTRRVIYSPDDWLNLNPLDPKQGYLAAQLECLRLVRSSLPVDTPLIQTIFSPLSQAKNLVGSDNLLTHLRRNPDAVTAGLETITESTVRFVEAAMSTGIDGVFYAVQHAQYGLLSTEEYRTFGRPGDLAALAPAQHAWLNLLHLHGTDIMFDQFLDYPVSVLNWHDQETLPSLSNALDRFSGAVCGGLRQWDTMVLGDPARVTSEARAAFVSTAGKRWILGTGCVTPVIAPRANFLAARQAVELPL